ncbi:phospholipase DDHD1-like isoform X2 [Leptopilina boulardi]|uniref:phospholipase DDHD1-like isoform X2 n=1 Tax=Leptopilina boulardi TaxID=63433 RepID=UPI0021F55245|nr:phospholipase DDHD1-like isoform X2 [Leptopilina boulardi]
MTKNLITNVDPFSEMILEDDYNTAEVSMENSETIDKVKGTEHQYADPLSLDEVRWFYCVNKRWTEFCGYDSLRIEQVWRNRSENADSNNCENNKLQTAERIVVRGGMYDVDLDKMKCLSIYWPGEEWEIMRGTWFYDSSWIPLETEHSERIEEVHLRTFQHQKLTQSNSEPELGATSHAFKVLHTEHFPAFHVDWLAINDVTLYSEYTPSKLMRSVTSKFGFTKSTGYQLRRGYKVRATMDDKPNDIDHLVFVVHGIGQKRDTGKIIRNTAAFRECVEWLLPRYFPKFTQRVEFFPVEWRSSLKLDGDIVDAITPYSVLSIRNLLNTSAMDILYYTSPLYGGEVRKGLQQELNRLYSMFINRHPGWNGKVSILAHSLGCVIVYDIVTGWTGYDTQVSFSLSSCEGLQFSIENLFCLGSPLSVFLALRTRAPSNRLEVMPEKLCKRFYNIFHWSDPVAYRMEPLLEKVYSKIEPVLIPSYGGQQPFNNQQQTEEQEVEGTEMEDERSNDEFVNEQLEQVSAEADVDKQNISLQDVDKNDSSSDSTNRNAEKGWSLWSIVRGGWIAKDGTSSPTPEMNSSCHPHEELNHRLDYVLRPSGLGRNYLTTLTSHTGYWNNYDVAYFVMTKLFPNLEM